MAEQLPPNTVDPTGRRGGKSRKQMFKEQLTSFAETQKRDIKEPTDDFGLEQTPQKVSEVPLSPLAGMLASKRDSGYSLEDRQRESTASETEGRPSYFDLREAYGHVRRTIRADKAKSWQQSFEQIKASSTLGQSMNSQAKRPPSSERDYYANLIKGHESRGEEVPSELQNIKARFDFEDKAKEFTSRGESLPSELEEQRKKLYPTVVRKPVTAQEQLEEFAAKTPIPKGTSHKVVKKSDGSVHVQTFEGDNLVATTPFGIGNVHTVHDIFENKNEVQRSPRRIPVIHRVTQYNAEGVKLSQEEAPKFVDTKTGNLGLPSEKDESEDKSTEQAIEEATKFKAIKERRARLYMNYASSGSKSDREATYNQVVSQDHAGAYSKVHRWLDVAHQRAFSAFYEKTGSKEHNMSREDLVEWHQNEKAKDAEAKQAKKVAIHNNIVDAMGIPK